MSSRSQLSHRTYGGSPNWLLDHHQPVLCVLHNCSSRQYQRVLAALNGADRNRMVPSKSVASPTFATKSARRRHMHRSRDRRYSITSSARLSSVGGTISPSAFAVLRLIPRSNLVGWWIGRPAGFAAWRIFTIISAHVRKSSSNEALYDNSPPASAKGRNAVAAGSRCLSARSAESLGEAALYHNGVCSIRLERRECRINLAG